MIKPFLTYLLLFFLFTGCGLDNDVTVYNAGKKEWTDIELKAGGNEFETDRLKGGGNHTFLFDSDEEGEGWIRGKLEGREYQLEFGYFTPNLSTLHEIRLEDSGSMTIK